MLNVNEFLLLCLKLPVCATNTAAKGPLAGPQPR